MTYAVDPATALETLRATVREYAGDSYTDAALRDILRRTAHDLGIRDRNAHPAMLPTIVEYAAEAIAREVAHVPDWQTETVLSAALTESVYFRAVNPGLGRRVPAGTIVTIRETADGLTATYREGWNIFRAPVAPAQLDPNI